MSTRSNDPSATPPHRRGRGPSRRALLGLAALVAIAEAPQAQTARPGSASAGAAPLPRIGQRLTLPDQVRLLDGSVLRPVHSSDKVLVLYWWASWCPFCALQTPLMDKLWRARRDAGLQLLGLSIDQKPEDAIAYLRSKGYAFPSAFVTPEIDKRLPRAKGLPITVVVGRDGAVKMAEAGQLFPEDIEAIARFL